MSIESFSCIQTSYDFFRCTIDLVESSFWDASVTEWMSAIGTLMIGFAAIIVLPRQLGYKKKAEEAEEKIEEAETNVGVLADELLDNVKDGKIEIKPGEDTIKGKGTVINQKSAVLSRDLVVYRAYHNYMASEEGIVLPEYSTANKDQRHHIAEVVAVQTNLPINLIIAGLESLHKQGKI